MSTHKNTATLEAAITRELAEEFAAKGGEAALKEYVETNVRERGYCRLHARNRLTRYIAIGAAETDGSYIPNSFHVCYLGIVIRRLREAGFHTERIIVTGTNPQLGECDIYATLQGMVEPRELHRLFSSAPPSEIGEARNPLHIVARTTDPLPMRIHNNTLDLRVTNADDRADELGDIKLRSLAIVAFAIIVVVIAALIILAKFTS